MNALPDAIPEPAPATVGIRALKQNASAVVARAAAGETLTITDRGRPVARLLPLPRKSRIQEMIEAGQITVPEYPIEQYVRDHTVDGRYVAPLTLPPGSPTLTETLLAMREEDRERS